MAPGFILSFLVWAWWLPLMLATAARAAEKQGEGCSAQTCGNLTISAPFWIARQDTERPCGSLDYQVDCNDGSTPILHSSSIFGFAIMNISYEERILRVVDYVKVEHLKNYSHCRLPAWNTSAKLGRSFRISEVNLNLIFYNCTKAPAAALPDRALVETKCRNNTFVRLGGRYDGSGNYDAYSLHGCSTIILPVLGTSGKANASSYEELMSNGFLLTWDQPAPAGRGWRHHGKLILIASLSATTILILTCLVWTTCRQNEKRGLFILQKYIDNESNIEEILKKYESLTPRRYSYSELKKITRSFQDKLGEGGYGMVFKGSLQDGRMVAVKLLTGSKGNGEEFLNEVISIGRTSHVNIVSLQGFCLQGSKRALVYEYMANGSLEKYIYSEESKMVIGWEQLRQIAIGIARGLEYLHRGCNTRIIHFDIKPHNILLDEGFCPKIADFGLAKLCHLKDSALSMAEARGTIGFIAPEVFSRGFGVVSTKSDVYSYGMMLLEMVGGRKNAKENIENSSEAFFPNWVYDRLVKDLQSQEVTCEMEENARQMTLVGFWCIQTTPGNRPSMSRVIEMLEKNINELEMPPKPFLSCPSPPSYFSS